MTSIVDLPSETLATVFEIGVHAWGINYLHHVSLVCKDWHLITNSHPHLWGILDIEKTVLPFRGGQILTQLVRAMEAPLDITFHASSNALRLFDIMSYLARLRHNFVRLQVPVHFLLATKYNRNDILNGLEVLDLYWGGQNPEADVSHFFEGVEVNSRPKLHSFTAHSLPPSWITAFLSPSLNHFHLHNTSNRRPSHLATTSPISETLGYLSRVPNVTSLELQDLDVYRLPRNATIPAHDASLRIPLPHLQHLELTNVVYKGTILHAIEAPSLRSLVIRSSAHNRGQGGRFYGSWLFRPEDTLPLRASDIAESYGSLIPFFVEWSNPLRTPTNLHTLELHNVLTAQGTSFLILWLHRLSNLVRLIIIDELDIAQLGDSAVNEPESSTSQDAPTESSLYCVLSHQVMNSSTGKMEWLCPLLTILHLDDVNIAADSVMAIARARGRNASDRATPEPTRPGRPTVLHRLTTQLCFCLSKEERDELDSLIKEVECTCVKCGFQSEM